MRPSPIRRRLSVLALLLAPATLSSQTPISGVADTVLHIRDVEEMTFRTGPFEIAASLYVPAGQRHRFQAVVWVPGSGPAFRKVRMPETKRMFNVFLDADYALLLLDKPGSGDSRGALHDDSTFAQLSMIYANAVQRLREHSLIDPAAIGLAGGSQAGYIMPLVASKDSNIAFMIGLSCPGENSIDQWEYLLERQMLCDGMTSAKARRNIVMFHQWRTTTSKAEFDEAIGYFEREPMVVPSLGYGADFTEQARRDWPRTFDSTSERWFDPMSVVKTLHLPIYLAYGGNDTQVDPMQGIEAYRRACAEAKNDRLTAVLFPNSDHNMKRTGGCLSEIRKIQTSPEYRYDPEFISRLREWLHEIRSTRPH